MKVYTKAIAVVALGATFALGAPLHTQAAGLNSAALATTQGGPTVTRQEVHFRGRRGFRRYGGCRRYGGFRHHHFRRHYGFRGHAYGVRRYGSSRHRFGHLRRYKFH